MTWTDEERERIASAYADVLDEPVPQRLKSLLAQPASPVVDFAAERERRKGPRAFASWAQWGGMAASVLIGVLVGMQLDGDALVAERNGQLVASAQLSKALDTKLASEPAGSVAVQLSFRDRTGRYCRTFSAEQVAGMACRDGRRWSVITMARAERAGNSTMRQASSTLPKAVLDSVDASISGTALDAAGERNARDAGWN